MLVLSRKTNESIRIGDNIEVVVLEVKHGKVRLGFRCPDDVPIFRSEVIGSGNGTIQAGLEEVADLGRRVIDPLGVADAYAERELIDHGA